MTWNTPLGNRTLTGIERRIVRAAIVRLCREIIGNSVADSACVGVAVFDQLTGCQQLVMLDYVRRYLFEDTQECNEPSAIAEGTAAAVIAFVSGCIEFEVEIEDELTRSLSGIQPPRYWRELIQKASRVYKWEIDPNMEPNDWGIALEMFHDRILHDRDYEMDFTDGPPETSNGLNAVLGIPVKYFTSIPLVEPDGPQMLEVIRRLLK